MRRARRAAFAVVSAAYFTWAVVLGAPLILLGALLSDEKCRSRRGAK